MEKTNVINEIKDRLDILEKPKGKSEPKKVDEEVCPECGGDLLFVEEGIVYCGECKTYYEHKEKKEE